MNPDQKYNIPRWPEGSGLKAPPLAQMTADQEIRARALECAVKYGANPQDWINFWDLVAKFEDYIRNGKT